ncbi:MAG: SDR family NAD(P)-dependent oxidoreductase, partial [Stellaceae bacterium]
MLLDALIGAVALRSMRGLIDYGQPFTVAELVETGVLAPGSSGLAEYLLRSLLHLGAARQSGSEWRLEEASDLPDVEEVWRSMLADAPDLVAELALIATAAADLPKVLAEGRQEKDPSPSPMVEHLLAASPASAAGIALVCNALGEIAAQWPKGQPLRVLEVGAIGGGATRRVLDCLAKTGVALAYIATSGESEQAARLSFLADSFSGVCAQQWSPEDGNEGLGEEPFDIILVVNACARLWLDNVSLAGLRQLLCPGGIFIALEPEPNALWDVIFGQNPDWWQGGADASNASPLRSGEEWRTELAAAGFRSAGAVSCAGSAWPCALLWGTASLREEPARSEPGERRAISLVAGVTPFATALQDYIREAGHHVLLTGYEDTLGQWTNMDGGKLPPIIVFLAEDPCGRDPIVSASAQITALARIAAHAVDHNALLWVITCDAQQGPLADDPACVLSSALWGFARVLVNEMTRLSVRLLDFAGGLPPAERARHFVAELEASTAENEIVWTPQGRHVLRVRRGLPPRLAKASDLLMLGARQPGGLDCLTWEQGHPRPVGSGQVEIEVHAAGLNFRDMMWAMGLLPEEALIDGFAGPTFGLECAGVIRSVGDGVTGLAVGDRVMGFAPASLGTQVVTTAEAVTSIPNDTSFTAAATIPVTFVTAIYSLGHLAQLARGESILIHAAAGGVGLAAIQYAKHRGALVIATAGSEVKRSFLRLAGADHVLDSRDLAFPDAVREITGGQGVDVVLNSLSGEAMERSLEVLRPFGRFLELGKRDLYQNRRVHLRPLRQNISYFAIDIDQLPVRRPELARKLLAEVSGALADGAIRPLAHRVFSFAELDDAFRLMQSASHIGKLVLVPNGNAGVRLREPARVMARKDGTYLVTGGLAGFGYEAARWLVACGAGSLALVGRRGPDTPGCEERVRELEAAGAEVRVYRGDVADSASLTGVLEAVRANQPPLRGIVHAASAIDDGLAPEIEVSRAEAVLKPKLGGALALDALTRNDPIELFLMFSSATTLVGAPAQGVYVAANIGLEALARCRRARGRPALAVAWGPIEDAGYLAERPETRDALARRLGAQPMAATDA